MSEVTGIPTATISRLVTYMRILERVEANLHERKPDRNGQYFISSSEIAERSGNSAFQVRKDLAYVDKTHADKKASSAEAFGTRGVGYKVLVLKRELLRVLGLNRPWNVVIVGVGRLGQAIANYPGASDYQFQYVGLFDVNPALIGTQVRGLTVRHMDELRDFVRSREADKDEQIHMGFLAVPPERAQDAAQSLADAGVRGILNFAPVVIQPLTVERGRPGETNGEEQSVVVENVDFLAGMKRLAFYIFTPEASRREPEEPDE